MSSLQTDRSGRGLPGLVHDIIELVFVELRQRNTESLCLSGSYTQAS